MKKNYALAFRHLWRAPSLFLLMLLLTAPSQSWGQTFTETFGTAGPKTVGAANTAKDFDNDQFIFGGNASLIATDQFIPASPSSGGSFIYFGDFNPQTGGSATALPANDRLFDIYQINNTQLTNIQLRFNLFIDPALASTTGDFVVEYSTNPGSRTPTYTTITAPSLATQGWRTITITNPFNGVTSAALALRFRRKVSAGDYIAIDDVQLTGTITPNFTVSPPDLAFANTAINGTSAAQSITVTGSGLTSNISVQAPTGYRIREQGSAAFLAEGAMLTLAPSGGNLNTAVEVVFNPTAPGTFSGQVAFTSTEAPSRFVSVSGTAVSPSITVSPTSLAFGNVEINTRSGVQSIAVEGANLSGDISVQVPTGYEFRESGDAGAPFLASGSTLTLAQTNGSISTVVEVRFAPVTVGTFNGNASFVSSGATSQFVAITGAGVAPAPVVTVTPSTIAFPDTRVGRTADPVSFFVNGQNLDNNTIVVSSPSAEFLIRLGRSGTFGPQVTLTGINGTLASTELQVQFAPSTVNERSATISASSGTTVNSILQVSGNALPAPTTADIFIVPDPATLDFGSVASNGSAQILTFRVGATLLGNNPLILTPASSASSNENIEIREANVGDFVATPLTFQSINGSVTERTIEVRLTGPLTLGQYQGTITASSTAIGAQSKVVNVIANSTGNSATISAENTLQPFSTVPGVASAIQSYLVNGAGLVRDITVRAPSFFQVALQEADFAGLNGATGNTITVVRNNAAGDGFTSPVRVYVRYLPTTANPQPDLAAINVTSEPAVGAAVQVEGLSAPSVEIRALIPEFRNVESGSVSAPVAVTVRALRVRQSITVAEVLTDASQFNNPLEEQFEISLKSDSEFGSTVTFAPNQSTFSIDQVVYVRYKPTHIGNASSKLQFRSNDFTITTFQDFAANGTLRGNALDNQPTAQSTINVVRNGSTATVTFTPAQGGTANGAGEGRLIIASLNNSLDGNSQPQDGQTYLSADGTIGQGATLPGAPDYYSVYTGAGNQAVVKGLDPTKAYYFYVFDYNYVAVNRDGERLTVPGAENYRTPTPPNQLVPVAASTPGTPLPVELVSFSAKLNKGRVNLAWETASEKDNKGFEVQRSADGVSFVTILFKKGQGNTNNKTAYVAVDEQPLAGVSYYRLKQIDHDGTTSLSPVVSVTNLTGVADIEMYPNPVQNTLNIRVSQMGKAGVQVTITDLAGRVVRTEQLAASGELNMSNLTNGTYLITVNEGTQKVTRRIVKN